MYSIDLAHNKVVKEGEEFSKTFGGERILSIYAYEDEDSETYGSSAWITKRKIYLLDEDFFIKSKYSGLNLETAYLSGEYLYVINEVMDKVTVQHYIEEIDAL